MKNKAYDIDILINPVFDEWGARCIGTEFGPFGPNIKKEDLEKIIVVESIKEEYMQDLFSYISKYDCIRLRWFKKKIGDPDALCDEENCDSENNKCNVCMNCYDFLHGLPPNPSLVDQYIMENFE